MHPNVEIIQAFFTAYQAQDQAAIAHLMSPDIRWHIPGRHPLSGTKTGITAVLDYLAQLGKAAFQARPLVMGANDQYVIDCHLNWSQAGPTLEALSCLLWKVEQQQIVEVYNFPQDQHQVDTFFTMVYGD